MNFNARKKGDSEEIDVEEKITSLIGLLTILFNKTLHDILKYFLV